MSVQLDYIQDDGGDWSGIYLNGRLIHDGHDIPDHVWIALFAQASFEHIEVRLWDSYLDNGGRYPTDFLEIADKLVPQE
jgi:hypothetical protein